MRAQRPPAPGGARGPRNSHHTNAKSDTPVIDLIPDDTRKLKAWRADVRAFLEEALPGGMRRDYDYNESETDWKKALEFWRKVGRKGWVALT